MSMKQTAPATGAAPKAVIDHSKTIIKLKAPYQRRCLIALVCAPVERTDLDRVIGTTNAPEFVKQLRRKGLTIHTEKIPFVNRDGHNKWRGKYHLDPKSRTAANQMLGGD